MKKIRLFTGACVTLFVLFFALPAFAQTDMDITGTTLTAYYGSDTIVSVPEGVTTIGEKAFYQNTDITQVILPSTITHIAPSAFEGCASLVSINFPSNLIDIQKAAFKDCVALQAVMLPRGLSSLGAESFYNCTNLSDAYVYEHLGTLGSECFRYCDALTIHCPQDTFIAGYASLIGASLDTFSYTTDGDFVLDGNTLVSYTGSDVTVTLPSGVTEIGAYAFAGNTKLNKLITPFAITCIQPYAFFDCSNLASITEQTELQNLGAYAFCGCSNLAEVTLQGDFCDIQEGGISSVYSARQPQSARKRHCVWGEGIPRLWCFAKFAECR